MDLTVMLLVVFFLMLPQTFAIDCPLNYLGYSGHCYRIHSVERNYTEARKTCQREGADLVSVNDRNEDNFLKSRLQYEKSSYWIGLVHTNKGFKWLDGTDVTYTHWLSYEPNCMGTSDDCRADYFGFDRKFPWEDSGIYNQIYFICELVPSTTTTTTTTTPPTTTAPSETDLQEAIHLECQHKGWYVTVDLDKLSRSPSDVSEIYMNEDTCVGTLQGGLLVFNKTYQECNTRAQVVNKSVTLNNYLVYATRDSNNMVRDLRWKEDLHCYHGYHASNTVNIIPNITKHGSSSGQIPGSPVDIKLYTDSAFSQPLLGVVNLGTPVYVQVLSLSHPDVAMVVDSCEAHLKTTNSQDKKLHALIQRHCSVDPSTTIIAVRNQVTRFKFNMFDLPSDDDGIYVTCNVVFCDPMDFSSQCEQTCKTSSNLVG